MSFASGGQGRVRPLLEVSRDTLMLGGPEYALLNQKYSNTGGVREGSILFGRRPGHTPVLGGPEYVLPLRSLVLRGVREGCVLFGRGPRHTRVHFFVSVHMHFFHSKNKNEHLVPESPGIKATRKH